jgi:hypothetical protein
MKTRRREFLQSAGAAGIAAFAGLRPLLAADAEVEIDTSNPGPHISPHIYGHFIEHLGGVIYDGIWVGRESKIPNIDGIRKQFVEDMKRIGAPNLRWPGAVSPTATIGETASARARDVRVRTTIGSTACLRGRTRWRATSSGSMSSCTCAGSSAPSPISDAPGVP